MKLRVLSESIDKEIVKQWIEETLGDLPIRIEEITPDPGIVGFIDQFRKQKGMKPLAQERTVYGIKARGDVIATVYIEKGTWWIRRGKFEAMPLGSPYADKDLRAFVESQL